MSDRTRNITLWLLVGLVGIPTIVAIVGVWIAIGLTAWRAVIGAAA